MDKKFYNMDKTKSISTKMSRASILKILNFDKNINKKDIVIVMIDPKKEYSELYNS